MEPLYFSNSSFLSSPVTNTFPIDQQRSQLLFQWDSIPASAYTIQNNLYTYVEQTKKYSHVTFEQAQAYIKEGEAFIQLLQAGQLDRCTREEKRQYALPFTWWLMSKAIEKGQGFQQGMFMFEDPSHRIADFFGQVATKRASSHYHGRIKGSNFGIDVASGLPYGFRTVLFGKLSTLGPNEGEWSFWKPENYGIESLKEIVRHGLDYLWSRVEFLFGCEQGPRDHKEDLLPLFKEHKKRMKKAGFTVPFIKMKDWGISGLIAALSPYMKNKECFEELRSNALKRNTVVAFLRDLLPRYDWAHVRQGNEALISAREDTSRACLVAFLSELERDF